jgi:hypothetical protein
MRKVPKGGKYTMWQTIHHANPNSPLLIPPKCRRGYLVRAYDEVAFHGKDYGMGGASPIKWTELEAWWRTFGVVYTKEEVRLIMEIDRLMMQEEASQNDDGGKS